MHNLLMPTLITVDTTALTDGIQAFMDNLFPWVGTALLILAPIAAIGIGFKFGGTIVSKLGAMLHL